MAGARSPACAARPARSKRRGDMKNSPEFAPCGARVLPDHRSSAQDRSFPVSATASPAMNEATQDLVIGALPFLRRVSRSYAARSGCELEELYAIGACALCVA